MVIRIQKAIRYYRDMKKNYTVLKRGGYLIPTKAGSIQIGVPPETIKDTMVTEAGVPRYFILPHEMFDWIKGISVAEIEFPLYFNFFVRNQKTKIICHADQLESIKIVLQESLFGPLDLDITNDFDLNTKDSFFQPFNLKKEIEYFRSNFELDDLVQFILIKKESVAFRCAKGKTKITIHSDRARGLFSILENGQMIAEVPARIDYTPQQSIGKRLAVPYTPPLFGITCLGPSHGFDPEQNTSGFLLWINHEGIMVDPPVDSTEWLIESNINPKLIDSVILTHCHADHDAGTFQKILEEGKITIYTTETILLSFLRKYSALSGMSIEALKELFYFHQVKIGEPVFIHGALFTMSYTLHSIPTVGFRLAFQETSFVYTSDHNNDPAKHRELFDNNIISMRRYNELKGFSWDSSIIYHESGIPPLHTPISYLDSLPEEIQKKIVVYHIASKDFPQETSLTLAKFGIEHTRYVEMEPPKHIEAYNILALLKHIDFFEDIPLYKTQEFLQIVQRERYDKGERIIEKGSSGDKFYIIFRGNVSVRGDNLSIAKIYGSYDYFGEVALVTQSTRVADVYAETNVILYTIHRNEFLSFISGTNFEKMLRRLAKIRTGETWNLLSDSPFFRFCSATQKTWLESIFIPVHHEVGGTLIREGQALDYIYIIRQGRVNKFSGESSVEILERGDIIGSIVNLIQGDPADYTYSHDGDLYLYALEKEEIRRFATKNPGLVMKIRYI